MSDKGARDWKVREKDSMANRRSRWDADQKKDAVDHYGKNTAMGNVRGSTGAGKGDKTRPTNAEKYEAGYNACFANTPEEREMWAARWQALHDAERQDQQEPVLCAKCGYYTVPPLCTKCGEPTPELEEDEEDDTPTMYKREDTGA